MVTLRSEHPTFCYGCLTSVCGSLTSAYARLIFVYGSLAVAHRRLILAYGCLILVYGSVALAYGIYKYNCVQTHHSYRPLAGPLGIL